MALLRMMLHRAASSAVLALLPCSGLANLKFVIPARSLTMGMASKKSTSAEDVAKAAAHEVLHTTSIVVSIKDNIPGALLRVLQPFHQHGISISKIESRPSRSPTWDFDFLMTFEGNKDDSIVKSTMSLISQYCHSLTVLGSHRTPWFPRTLQDLDRYAMRKLEYGSDVGEDHPGFVDPEYRARRSEITQNALKYRTGAQLPDVKYSTSEIETWGVVYDKIMRLVPTHACHEYQYILPVMREKCAFSRDSIPQMSVISDFLKGCTGFTLRPVSGLLTSRDFLNALAFRVFFSTQYIRHHSKPLYTPEPDVCHEFLGHVPLFADPNFADFVQEVGLASLGVSDDDIAKLATVFWFTVEFGLVRQAGELRAYGAGLLSSFGELEYCLSNKPNVLPFDPAVTSLQKYPITDYQPVYYECESFASMTKKLKDFASSLQRPFKVELNPYASKVIVTDK